MGGLNLTFSVRSASNLRVVLTALFVILGIIAPLVYGMWFIYLGGDEKDRLRRVQKLVESDPVQDARREIERGSPVNIIRLLDDAGNRNVPAVYSLAQDAKPIYRTLLTVNADQNDTEKQRLNQRLAEYVERYNRTLQEAVTKGETRFAER